MELFIGIITSVTAVIVLGTAVVGWLKIRSNEEQVQEIHVMVNSRLRSEQDWNDSLSEALQAAGINVPPRPSRIPLPPLETPPGVEPG